MNRTIKHITAASLSVLCLISSTTAVHAFDPGRNSSITIGAADAEDGFYINPPLAAVGFHSYNDYADADNRSRAYDRIKGSSSSGEVYLTDRDFIYVPASKTDHLDEITDIMITPRYCKVTFEDDTYVYYYYIDDNKSSSYEYTSFAVPFGTRITVNGTDHYSYNGGYYCNIDGRYFSFNTSTDIEDAHPLTKIYADSHLIEEDGRLYYIGDNGEKESGWHTIGGHSYFFRTSDKAAIQGKAAKIGGVLYRFNANGVCKGKYTGYAMSNGETIYYKDGIRS